MNRILPFSRKPQNVAFRSQAEITRENRERRSAILERIDGACSLPSLQEKIEQVSRDVERIKRNLDQETYNFSIQVP